MLCKLFTIHYTPMNCFKYDFPLFINKIFKMFLVLNKELFVLVAAAKFV